MQKNKKKLLLLIIFQISFLHALPNFVLMGPPGAGKGTFADMLVAKNNYTQICPGALLRAEAAQETSLGKSIKAAVEQAKPIDASIVCEIVRQHLEAALAKKSPFVLDGFPKNKECFDFLVYFLKERGLAAIFMHFFADDKICFERIVSRLECHTCEATFNEVSKKPSVQGVCDRCQSSLVRRKGDDHATADYRLREYHENIEPVINDIKQRNLVVEIDTSHAPIDYCDTIYKQYACDHK